MAGTIPKQPLGGHTPPPETQLVDFPGHLRLLEQHYELANHKETPEALQPFLERLNGLYQTSVLSRRIGPEGGKFALFWKVYRRVMEFLGFPGLASWERQVAFNAQLVQLLNQVVLPHQQALRRQTIFNNEVIVFYRTKMLEMERTLSFLDYLDQRIDGVTGGLRELDEWIRRFESQTREVTGWVEAMGKDFNAFREHQSQQLEEVQNLFRSYRARAIEIFARVKDVQEALPEARRAALERLAEEVMDEEYFEFENRFRGSREEITQRQSFYVPIFKGQGPVLDLGCGRGEFLALMAANGVEGRGVDANKKMVAFCQELGLKAEQGNALDYLRGLESGSLGGIMCAHFIEHFSADNIVRLVREMYRVLRPGGIAAIETQNVSSPFCLSHNFFLDMDHETPVHPAAMKVLMEEWGFAKAEITYLQPVPEHIKLSTIPVKEGDENAALIEKINENAKKLNDWLYSDQDFVVIGRK